MTKQKTFSRVTLGALAGTLMLAFAGTAMAGEVEKTLPRGGKDDGPAAKGINTPATAPFARLAAFIRPGGRVVRQVGVQSVTNPEVGVYCIRPTAASGVNPGDSIVMVTPEFRFSAINEVKVQWMSERHGCGANRIAVITLADFDADGFYGFSDDVAFAIYVP